MNYKNFLIKIKRNKKKIIKSIIIIIYAIPIFLMSILGAWIVYMDLRPAPNYFYDPILQLEHWTVVAAGDDITTQHNSNTDMIYYNNSFYLIHAQTKWHLEDPNGALVIRKSTDATAGSWEEIHRITLPNTDVRDPKFANISGRLFVYFLPNLNFDPSPHTTYFTYYNNISKQWTEPVELKVNVTYKYTNGTVQSAITGGWNLWRPKTRDNVNWYVIASGRKYKEDPGAVGDADVTNTMTILLKTQDGFNWTEVSEVYTTHGNGETCFEFLPNGEMISTHRVGSMGLPGYALGNPHACTVIGTSYNNFLNWSFAPDFQTRLDGSTLISLSGRIFAVGRNHLGPRADMGNHFTTKRTAFYEVKSDRLIHLFDLPSNGDTSYTGVVVKDDFVYTCYYTSPIEKDYAWVIGIMFLPKTDIRIAKVSVSGLLMYADIIGGS